MTTNSLYKEIYAIMEDAMYRSVDSSSREYYAKKILELITNHDLISKSDLEHKIDKKIELINQEVLDPSFIAINDCMGCIQEKKKAYLEMKDLLRK